AIGLFLHHQIKKVLTTTNPKERNSGWVNYREG
ncbi:hypothetical protein EZS27_038433, partial [termite gut metagenome]